MRMKHRVSIPVVVALAGFLVGLVGTVVYSAERPSARRVSAALSELTRLDAVRVLPRTELLLIAVEARMRIDAGRPWSAWRLMRDNLGDADVAPAEAVMTAAEAAAGWGGWSHVVALLESRVWLGEHAGAEGRFLLARAKEEMGDANGAIAEYRAYLAQAEGRSRGVALARLGGLLRESGDAVGAAAAFGRARAELPQIADWMLALQAEQLAAAGETNAATLASRGIAGSAPVRLRRVRAEVTGLRLAGDLETAAGRLEREVRVLTALGAGSEAARLQFDRASLMTEMGKPEAARDLLRVVAWDSAAPVEVRSDAAELLGEMTGSGAPEHLARAAALEAADRPGLAARALRTALEAGAPDGGGIRLRIARLLYDARDHGAARTAFLEAADRLDEPELAADARLHAARSLYRIASRQQSRALDEMRRVIESYPGTAAAGTAHFLLGDEASTLAAALSHYRRAAAIEHSPFAREALFRAADRSLKLNDPAEAARLWKTYVERYPEGSITSRVAYTAARLQQRRGRQLEARDFYAAAMHAEPTSYYAIRASDRLRVDPLAGTLTQPHPWPGLAIDPVEAGNVLRRLDALHQAGLGQEWRAELEAAIRSFGSRPAALIVLGEGLRERDRPLDAIRIGHKLREIAGGHWDERLLKLVYPFPYRDLLEDEAHRAGVDPFLLAGLVRQESSFRPAVRSWVGATGLGQIMPATGRWLAPSVGIGNYEEKLLEAPEVNLRMSARYIGDLLKRYNGAVDLALAGYNAGPSRADRWRRTLGYGGDPDEFRERIPFDETREYVRIVIRNAAIYERLYGDSPARRRVPAD
jgi:soluble lytic murein transglycosylase